MIIPCKNDDHSIEIENMCKDYYLFNRDYRIFQWLFTRKGYSIKKTALKDINLVAHKGEVLGIIGKNGSGKSTLMKLVAGIAFPSAGIVRANGKIGSLINLGAGFNPDFTGRKNIYYKGMLIGMSRAQIDAVMEEIIEFVDIGDYFDMPIRTYSSGMSARLGFALAAYSDPDILIIDEVFAVGDKEFQTKSKQKTIDMLRSGKTVLFSSHSDALIKEFCQRVVYIRDSHIVFDGDVGQGLAMYNADITKR